MNLFQKWKEEWWRNRENELCSEYSKKEQEFKEELETHLSDDRRSFEINQEVIRQKSIEMETRLIALKVKEVELGEWERRIGDKKFELESLNLDLLQQIKNLESKASPSHVWVTAFTSGWDKAWDMMKPFMTDGLERSKKAIEDAAIQSTLRITNGNNKKIN